MKRKTDGWFDGRGIELLKQRVVEKLPRWNKYVEDGVISPGEKRKQYQIVHKKLKKLEPKVPASIYEDLTDVLLEYEVLLNMHAYRPGVNYGALTKASKKVPRKS
jgi:hypothetical protein